MSVWGHRREVWAEDQGLVWSSDNGSLEKERERGLNGTFCWGKVLVWLVMGEANGDGTWIVSGGNRAIATEYGLQNQPNLVQISIQTTCVTWNK